MLFSLWGLHNLSKHMQQSTMASSLPLCHLATPLGAPQWLLPFCQVKSALAVAKRESRHTLPSALCDLEAIDDLALGVDCQVVQGGFVCLPQVLAHKLVPHEEGHPTVGVRAWSVAAFFHQRGCCVDFCFFFQIHPWCTLMHPCILTWLARAWLDPNTFLHTAHFASVQGTEKLKVGSNLICINCHCPKSSFLISNLVVRILFILKIEPNAKQ